MARLHFITQCQTLGIKSMGRGRITVDCRRLFITPQAAADLVKGRPWVTNAVPHGVGTILVEYTCPFGRIRYVVVNALWDKVGR